ncbi:MAG: hypothetical protein J4F39_08255 [Candidatus Latescibacteria bacterium]|nr:hypothetical protein [Candidatus Latescibacterota bacterium]
MKLNVWIVAAGLAMGNGIVNPSPTRAGNAVNRATEKCWRSANPDCVSRLTLQAAKAFVARSDWELEIRAGAFAAGAAALALEGNSRDARENFDLAVAAARSIKSGYARVRALRNVASAQAEAGDVDSARATARLIGDVQGRIDAMVGVASASARNGDVGVALESFRIAVAAARSNGTGDHRARGLSKVAMAQAAVGYIASARATARSIDDIQNRVDALANVASALAQEGKRGDARAFFDLAVADAGTITDGYRRAVALGKVAWAQAEAGDESGARKTLDRALRAGGNGMDVYSAGATIASMADVDPYVLFMKVGDLNGARKTLDRAYQSVSEDASRLQVKWLFNIASAQNAAGNAGGARRAIELATRRLMSAGDDELAQSLVYQIAADQLETMLEIAVSRNPADIESKKNLVYHVAMRQAQKGETRRSLHNAGMIDRVSRRRPGARRAIHGGNRNRGVNQGFQQEDQSAGGDRAYTGAIGRPLRFPHNARNGDGGTERIGCGGDHHVDLYGPCKGAGGGTSGRGSERDPADSASETQIGHQPCARHLAPVNTGRDPEDRIDIDAGTRPERNPLDLQP